MSTLEGHTEKYRKEHNLKKDQWWAVLRDNKPSNHQYWTDLAKFREELVRDIEQMWTTLSPIIDRTLSQ